MLTQEGAHYLNSNFTFKAICMKLFKTVNTSALSVTFLYGFFASMWIVFSDLVMGRVQLPAEQLTLLNQVKGIVFVAITSLLLYALLSRFYKRQEGEASESGKHSLRFLAISFVLITFIVPVVVGTLIQKRVPQIEKQAQEHLQTLAQLQALQVDQWYSQRSKDLQGLEKDVLFAQAVQGLLNGDVQQKDLLFASLQKHIDAYGYSKIKLLQGNDILLSLGDAIPPPESSHRDDLQTAIVQQRRVSTGLYSNDINQLYLDWFVPLTLVDAETPVVARVHSRVGDLLQQILSVKLESLPQFDAHFVLFQEQVDTLVVSVDQDILWVPYACERTDWLGQVHQRSTSFKSLNCHKDEVLFGAYYLDQYDAALVVEVNPSWALESFYASVIWMSLFSLLLALLMSSLLWVSWRQNEQMHQVEALARQREGAALLDYVAHYDHITNLPNRSLFLEKLVHLIKDGRRHDKTFALILFDIDRFKDINDSFGHNTGDILLKKLAQRLSARLDQVDTLARMGGDEFALIVEGEGDLSNITHIAVQIGQLASEPIGVDKDLKLSIGVSIGISLYPHHGMTADQLMQNADAAMYRAKAEGKGRFAFYSDDLTQMARLRVQQEAKLKRAFFKQHLEVFYQPQVNIQNGHIDGAEALVRWLDPEVGLISPAEFIPIAEETGLIMEIGEWVLRRVCQQGKTWLDQGYKPLRLAVNVSAQQFAQGDIVTTVADILAQTGYPAAFLELEVTESAFMQSSSDIDRVLRRLRKMGVSVALDDFGTGYSSLAYLKRFDLDMVKIDKSFIDEIVERQQDQKLVSAIVEMGHALNLKVLAEGVESQAQLQVLREQGCDAYQGFLTSQALPEDKFRQLLN